MSEPCQFLDWDTEFFGRRIARVNDHRLDAHYVQAILEWCAARQIECLYFLADSDHGETVRLAEDHGFRFVDIRLTLRHPNPVWQEIIPSSGLILRKACLDDLPTLELIARNSYYDSRYYFDPCFPEEVSSGLYDTWIKNSLTTGYADAVLVTELDSQPVGYISCHLSPDGLQGKIGLVGVSSQAQGRGVGRHLLHYTMNWFATQGARSVDVATQGRNIPAQRLYQRGGFLTHSVQLWYHKWFIDCDE